jgi:predicted transcriptional regulator
VAITIAAISNMVDMLRGHEKLEMLDAEDHKLKHLLDKLSEHDYGGKIELPAEDTNRPVRFDDPKKNPQ